MLAELRNSMWGSICPGYVKREEEGSRPWMFTLSRLNSSTVKLDNLKYFQDKKRHFNKLWITWTILLLRKISLMAGEISLSRSNLESQESFMWTHRLGQHWVCCWIFMSPSKGSISKLFPISSMEGCRTQIYYNLPYSWAFKSCLGGSSRRWPLQVLILFRWSWCGSHFLGGS